MDFLINYFQHRFQCTSPQEIQEKFLHAVQESNETIEEWGHRLNTIVTDMQNFGMQLYFEDYITQWIKGVRNVRFASKLREVMRSEIPGRAPAIYDYASFSDWYQQSARFLPGNGGEFTAAHFGQSSQGG